MNHLYYGDNLDILRDNIADETIDLIYLDPPFNSNADYNVLFRSPKGEQSHAQIEAFEDTWHWNEQANREFAEVVQNGNTDVAEMIQALRRFLGDNDMMAYLVMMTNRLIELHRVLRSTGSIYLHCDPTASHYLKLVLDAVFGKLNYRSEIIWKRTSAHSSAHRYGPIHDVIFYYSKSDEFVWNEQFQPYDEVYVREFYTHVDPDGRRWRRSDLTGAGTRNGETGLPWRGLDVTAKGRHWAYPPSVLDEMDAAGKIHWPAKEGGMPMLKRYLDQQPGVPLQDVWTDIAPMHNLSEERLGYPTQKPLALLERIIKASSHEDQVVLDPFCGCGTATVAGEKLRRRWIGIDITHLAVSLIEQRIRHQFPNAQFDVKGTPKDIESARDLAERDKYQFQWWACSLVKARPFGGQRKGADGGIDGVIYFHDGGKQPKKAIVSVKGGASISVAMVRDLAHVVEREKAAIGLFVTLAPPTRPMVQEALKMGFYYPEAIEGQFPRLQILTIEGLLEGREQALYPDLSRGATTFRRATRMDREPSQRTLL